MDDADRMTLWKMVSKFIIGLEKVSWCECPISRRASLLKESEAHTNCCEKMTIGQTIQAQRIWRSSTTQSCTPTTSVMTLDKKTCHWTPLSLSSPSDGLSRGNNDRTLWKQCSCAQRATRCAVARKEQKFPGESPSKKCGHMEHELTPWWHKPPDIRISTG